MPADHPERDRAGHYAARSLADSTKRKNGRVVRYFGAWCDAHGLCPLPAAPRTVALYLVAHVDEWKPATLNNHRSAIASAHTDAGHRDPTSDHMVTDLTTAIARMKRGAPTSASPEPLLAEDLARVCAAPLRSPSLATELVALRCRIAAITTRCHGLEVRRLVRIPRSGIEHREQTFRITVPEIRLSGYVAAEQVIELTPDDDTFGLIGLLDRFMAIVPDEVGERLFSFATAGAPRQVPVARANQLLRSQARGAARRAKLAADASLEDLVRSLSPTEFSRFLWHCDRWAHVGLRAQAMSSVGFALALRPGELRRLRVEDVTAVPGGFDIGVVRLKNNPGRVLTTKALHHWPDCPPHCPACLLATWLATAQVSTGALFPASDRGRVLTDHAMTDGALKAMMRRVEDAASLGKHVSPKSVRSGYVTSATLHGAEAPEIMATTDHASVDVLRKHYVLTNKGATHQLGRSPTSRSA